MRKECDDEEAVFNTRTHVFKELDFHEHDKGDKHTLWADTAQASEAAPQQGTSASAQPPADTDVPMPPVETPPPLPAFGPVIPASPPRPSAHQGALSFGDIGDPDAAAMDMDAEDSQTSGDDLHTQLQKLNTEGEYLVSLLIFYSYSVHCLVQTSETDDQVAPIPPVERKFHSIL